MTMGKRVTTYLLLTCFAILPVYTYSSSERSLAIADSYVVDVSKTDARLSKQPNGPFATLIFAEDALAIHIGIIYYDQMAVPKDGNWWISERFWQDRKWGSDITSLAWSLSGKYLYLATSRIYGDGGVFRLNLLEKEYVRIYPRTEKELGEILYTEIIGLDKAKRILEIRVTLSDMKTTNIIQVPLD
jgi:hypothetical protein